MSQDRFQAEVMDELRMQEEWKGLSDDDVTDLVNFWNISDIEIEPFIEMVVRKVKEKKT